MANPKKSKVVGKRPYAKKASYWDNKKSGNFTSFTNETKAVCTDIKTNLDSEIEQLASVCRTIDKWDSFQKERNLRFIFSKYSDSVN
jgi:hypothetical protein